MQHLQKKEGCLATTFEGVKRCTVLIRGFVRVRLVCFNRFGLLNGPGYWIGHSWIWILVFLLDLDFGVSRILDFDLSWILTDIKVYNGGTVCQIKITFLYTNRGSFIIQHSIFRNYTFPLLVIFRWKWYCLPFVICKCRFYPATVLHLSLHPCFHPL